MRLRCALSSRETDPADAVGAGASPTGGSREQKAVRSRSRWPCPLPRGWERPRVPPRGPRSSRAVLVLPRPRDADRVRANATSAGKEVARRCIAGRGSHQPSATGWSVSLLAATPPRAATRNEGRPVSVAPPPSQDGRHAEDPPRPGGVAGSARRGRHAGGQVGLRDVALPRGPASGPSSGRARSGRGRRFGGW